MYMLHGNDETHNSPSRKCTHLRLPRTSYRLVVHNETRLIFRSSTSGLVVKAILAPAKSSSNLTDVDKCRAVCRAAGLATRIDIHLAPSGVHSTAVGRSVSGGMSEGEKGCHRERRVTDEHAFKDGCCCQQAYVRQPFKRRCVCYVLCVAPLCADCDGNTE